MAVTTKANVLKVRVARRMNGMAIAVVTVRNRSGDEKRLDTGVYAIIGTSFVLSYYARKIRRKRKKVRK